MDCVELNSCVEYNDCNECPYCIVNSGIDDSAPIDDVNAISYTTPPYTPQTGVRLHYH
jgi:hypothetical protein